MSQKKITDNMDVFGEKFEGIDFSKKRITKSEFDDCTFKSCDFTETFFSSCKFIDCRFENCNLTLIKLTDSKLSGLEFFSCKLIGIDWTMADWKSLLNANPLRFKECALNDSNFYGLPLDDIIIKECEAREVDFSSGSFKNGDFKKTDFKGALFSHTNLEGANFTNASNTLIDLKSNHLKGAIFNRFEALYMLESLGIVLVD